MPPDRAPSAAAPASIAFCGATVGCGHGRAALAIRDAMRVRGQLGSTAFIDALEHAAPWFARLYRDGYLAAVRHAPLLVGALYERTDVPRHVRGRLRAAADRLDDAVHSRLRRLPELHGSDVAVSTHFLTTALLGRMRLAGTLAVPLVTVVTDAHPHAAWLHRGSDLTFVADERARAAAVSGGLDPSRVVSSGIPVDPRFGLVAPVMAWRDGPTGHRPSVLVTGGGFGIGDLVPTVVRILSLARGIDLTVVCGRNEALESRMRELAAGRRGDLRGNALRVVGYTKVMHELMSGADLLVGKPGGLTTAESCAIGLPMVLLRPIPGQEERNANAMHAAGAAVSARSPEGAATAVVGLLGDRSRLDSMRRAAAAIGRPKAAFDVASRIAALSAGGRSACAERLIGIVAA